MIEHFVLSVVRPKKARNSTCSADLLYVTRQTIHCVFEQKITSICTTMFVFRRLLPAYSSLARFPQLIFTKDNSAEYKAEMEHLLNKAKLNDTGFGGEWGWNQEKVMSQDRCHSRILVVYHQQFFRNFDLKTCISMERNQCSLYSMALMFSFQTRTCTLREFYLFWIQSNTTLIDIFNHQIVALPAGAEPNLKSGLRYTKVGDGLWFYFCVIQPS